MSDVLNKKAKNNNHNKIDPSIVVKDGGVLVDIEDLEVKFSVRNRILTAIRKISLQIYKGEVLAIVGESASGKSVFTKCLTGMLDANGSISNGTIKYLGADLAQFSTVQDWLQIRGKRISTVFQDPMTSLNPLLTIGFQISEVLRLHHGLSKQEAKEEAIKLLKKVRIPNAEARYDDYPFQ